jgi:vancomycin resistance protein VanJ
MSTGLHRRSARRPGRCGVLEQASRTEERSWRRHGRGRGPVHTGLQHGRKQRPRWPLRLALGYLVLVCAIGLLARTLGERLWWTNVLLYLPQMIYLSPAVVTLPAALWKRDGRAVLVTGLAMLVVAWLLMGFNIPVPQPAPPPERPRVRVLAYNIRGALSGWHLIRKQVDTFRPDVVVFSEAAGWNRTRQLQAELKEQFPDWDSVQGGEMYVASRWPILEREAASLGRFSGREKVRARVDAPFGRFNVVGVHFYTAMRGRTLRKERRALASYMNHTAAVREQQALDVLEWTARLEEPTILAGDLNTPPAGIIYGRLARRFRDAFAAGGWGWGYTYPAHHPLLRIDYVFYSPHWQATTCQVGAGPGSDHRPVFAELALK